MYVILDPHDYGTMRNGDTSYKIGTAEVPARHFANFWARLATVYKNHPNVIFNLINEPNGMAGGPWQDHDSSGTNTACSVGAGAARLDKFIAWARTYKKTAHIGEFGWSTESQCATEGRAFMNEVVNNKDVFIGWVYFAAHWYNGFMTLNGNSDGTDKPQTKLVMEFLDK